MSNGEPRTQPSPPEQADTFVKREIEQPDRKAGGREVLPVPDYDGEVGASDPVEPPDVDISLQPSRMTPIAGELWSIGGDVHNRSSRPVWIVDTTTRLSPAPEIFGQLSDAGSINAFFPTILSRPQAEIVRIDPGANYSVVWKIDPARATEGDQNVRRSLRRRILSSIRNFAFFNPGTFRVSATVHIWTTAPRVDKNGRVTNMGASYCKSVAKDIPMEASPWVLILGAACGGVLCFLLQLLFGFAGLGSTVLSAVRTIAFGLSSAVILSGVVTVLLSRLATTDFVVVVKVKDLWGAVATGFVVQWFGYGILSRVLGTTGPG